MFLFQAHIDKSESQPPPGVHRRGGHQVDSGEAAARHQPHPVVPDLLEGEYFLDHGLKIFSFLKLR